MDAHKDLHSSEGTDVSTQHDFVRDKSATLCVVCQVLGDDMRKEMKHLIDSSKPLHN